MKIDAFLKKYGKTRSKQEVSKIMKRWQAHDFMDRFLGTTVAPGIFTIDILTGEGLVDLSPELRALAEKVSGGHQTKQEIKDFLVENVGKDDSVIQGHINNFQGKIGEWRFENISNKNIELAQADNQAVVDFKRNTAEGVEFVQVKVYSDPNDVIEKIREANQKVAGDTILWNKEVQVENPPVFAVNEDIYEEVKSKAAQLGLPNKIESLGITRDEIRYGLENGFENIQSEFFANYLSPVAMSVGIQSLFEWYYCRNMDDLLEQLPRNLIVSSSGVLGSAMGRAVALRVLGMTSLESTLLLSGGFAFAGGFAAASFARGLSIRLMDRIGVAQRMEESSQAIRDAIAKIHRLGSR